MPRLARRLITLPVLILPLAAWVTSPASASTLSVDEGLFVLAKSKASDGKCGFLSRSERQELSGYLARAEVASQSMIGGAAVNAAIAKGRTAGRTAACNSPSRADVEETVAAARLAVAQADGVKPARAQTAESEKKLDKSRKLGPVAPPEYGKLAKPYFVDLRCKQLTSRKARLFYEAIKDLQKASIAKHGTAAIAAAQAKTRKSAQTIACGPASRQLAEQGLAAILLK